MTRTVMVVLAAIFVTAFAGASGAYIGLDEVSPGMTGYGLTVVAGDELVEFDVEVVGVVHAPGDGQNFIAIRASGEAIERSGGIAQGMSGSPVYLDGRLAGALSRAAIWTATPDRPLGLVTPIEDMLEVLAEVRDEPPSEPRFPPEEPTPPEDTAPDIAEGKLYGAALHHWPLQTPPVLAAGLSSRAIRALREGFRLDALDSPLTQLLPSWAASFPGLEELGISRVIDAPGVSTSTTWELRPGGPVGVSLMVGDMHIGSLGTVTEVDGAALVAMGHHFLFSGPSRYFLTQAEILDTVQALNAPFKFGMLGDIEGGIYADRWAAVGGRTGVPPQGIDVAVQIRDLSHPDERISSLRTTMAREPRLQPLLLYLAGLEATDRGLDRRGAGTVSVRYEIEGDGMPHALSLSNVFLSTQDVAVYASLEAAMILNILQYNEFQDPALTSVHLEAEVSKEFRVTEITDLSVHGQAFGPGDIVPFTVYGRDWRGEERSWSGELRIPPRVDGPYVELRAYGGPRPLEKGEAPPVMESLEDLLGYIERVPGNDTLTVELFATDPLTQLTGVEHLVGVDGRTLQVPETVVVGEISLYIPLEQED